MAKTEVFHVVNNVTLDFESEGLKYTMRLLIENGLIMLTDDKGREETIVLGRKSEYTGEPIETLLEIPQKSVKKRKRNKHI